MSAARRDALQKLAGRENRKPPVQVVSPEKLQRRSSSSSNASPAKVRIFPLGFQHFYAGFPAYFADSLHSELVVSIDMCTFSYVCIYLSI